MPKTRYNEPTRILSVYLPESTYKGFSEMAKRKDLYISQYARWLIKEAIEKELRKVEETAKSEAREPMEQARS